MKFQKLKVVLLNLIALSLIATVRAVYAAPSIIDLEGVINEGYPNTGGFVAQDATSLTVTTPNTSVNVKDCLVVLATSQADSLNIATTTGRSTQWKALPDVPTIPFAGAPYAWIAVVTANQRNAISATITSSTATNINAIMFDVTGAVCLVDNSKYIDGTVLDPNQVIDTPPMRANHDGDLVVAFAATQYPEAMPAVASPIGASDLNWLGLGGVYPTAGSPMLFEEDVAIGSYTGRFNMSTFPGYDSTVIFALR
jgi:hypothetical protein